MYIRDRYLQGCVRGFLSQCLVYFWGRVALLQSISFKWAQADPSAQRGGPAKVTLPTVPDSSPPYVKSTMQPSRSDPTLLASVGENPKHQTPSARAALRYGIGMTGIT